MKTYDELKKSKTILDKFFFRWKYVIKLFYNK